MKIQVTLEFDVEFDLESDGETLDEDSVINSAKVGQDIVEVLHSESVIDEILENMSTEWCVTRFGVHTRLVKRIS